MSRKFELYLSDIAECCQNVKEYTRGMSFEEFSADKKTIDAVVRNLEIIGQAVKNIPNELLENNPEIEWKKIARFRDIIVHRYFKIDLEVVWDVIENQLTKLETAVGKILMEMKKEEN